MAASGILVDLKTHMIVDSDGFEHSLGARGECMQCGKRSHPLGNRRYFSADISTLHWGGSKIAKVIAMYKEPRAEGVYKVVRWFEGLSCDEEIPRRIMYLVRTITNVFQKA